jgi:hypothetical protein
MQFIRPLLTIALSVGVGTFVEPTGCKDVAIQVAVEYCFLLVPA